MPGADAFTVEGRVLTARGPGVAVVELANGHRLVGHLPRRLRVTAPPLAAGMRVRMRLSPCDLSHGRISEILTG